MFARALAVDYELDVGGRGWEAFQGAVRIRNRIMHPKHVSDLEITDEELGHVHRAAAWYKESTLLLYSLQQRESGVEYAKK